MSAATKAWNALNDAGMAMDDLETRPTDAAELHELVQEVADFAATARRVLRAHGVNDAQIDKALAEEPAGAEPSGVDWTVLP